MATRNGWRGWYGNEDAVDPEVFREWRKGERERMRMVMRERRARLKAARGPGEPVYRERVLAFIERWLEEHRGDPDTRMELDRLIAFLRRAARIAGLSEDDVDQIQDRGTAKFLRKLGYALKRRSAGMVVCGLWVKPTGPMGPGKTVSNPSKVSDI